MTDFDYQQLMEREKGIKDTLLGLKLYGHTERKARRACPSLLYKYEQAQLRLEEATQSVLLARNEVSNASDEINAELTHRRELRNKIFNYGSFDMVILPKRRLNTIKILEGKSAVVTFTSLKIISGGWRNNSYIKSIEYGYLWPNCGCELHTSDDVLGRRVRKIQGIIPYLQEFMVSFLSDQTNWETKELKCPRCQVCDDELDFMCEGYEEESPLTGETGKLVWGPDLKINAGMAAITENEVLGALP